MEPEVKMYSVQVHKRINQIIKIFYRFGLWRNCDECSVRETRIKLLYSFYYFLLPISSMAGALSSDNKDESILLMEVTIMSAVMFVQLLYIIWGKKEILEMLNLIGLYSIESQEDYTLVNEKTNRLMKFATIFVSTCYFIAGCIVLIVPFVGSQKKLFFNIGFPLDYTRSDFGYWTALAFTATEAVFCAIILLFSVIMWYLMINCSLRYELLGQQLKTMGAIKTVDEGSSTRKITDIEKQNVFHNDLIASIESHRCIKESINQVGLFLSTMFSVQLVTSGLGICCSIYCLAFNNSEHVIEHLILLQLMIYNIFSIFLVMYFGNEIKLSSDKLSYCLFESDWVDQPQSTKKEIIIFGEILRPPHELVILTLYPLTLDTFGRILNSAYNMFNILKNIK